MSKVLLANSNKYLLKYCIYDLNSNVFVYPFAKYNLWIHWIQNTTEQYQVNGQCNIYLKKNLENDNLTKEALQSILHDNSKELENLLARIQKFNANIVGSNTYFYKRRSELESLME